MARKRSLKPKDIERLEVLQRKHPGDLTEKENKDLVKLQMLRSKFS